MTQDLFEGGTQDQLPQVDQDKNYLEELVGEGKKFKDVQALARGKAEADTYVEILKRSNDEIRDQLLKTQSDASARANLEDLIKDLRKPDSEITPPANEDESKAPSLRPDEIEQMVQAQIEKREIARRQQDNFNSVQAKLRERFGDNTQRVLEEQRKNLNLSVEQVNTIAKDSPAAFLRLMGLDQTQREDTFQSPPRSQQRSDSFAPKGPEKRTWSYYKALQKKNPDIFRDPKTNVQMQKDAMELREAFFDTD
jgi:hypothetical protein